MSIQISFRAILKDLYFLCAVLVVCVYASPTDPLIAAAGNHIQSNPVTGGASVDINLNRTDIISWGVPRLGGAALPLRVAFYNSSNPLIQYQASQLDQLIDGYIALLRAGNLTEIISYRRYNTPDGIGSVMKDPGIEGSVYNLTVTNEQAIDVMELLREKVDTGVTAFPDFVMDIVSPSQAGSSNILGSLELYPVPRLQSGQTFYENGIGSIACPQRFEIAASYFPTDNGATLTNDYLSRDLSDISNQYFMEGYQGRQFETEINAAKTFSMSTYGLSTRITYTQAVDVVDRLKVWTDAHVAIYARSFTVFDCGNTTIAHGAMGDLSTQVVAASR